MSSQNQVQTLLDAEKEASKIVLKAKQYRVQRLKDARAEASKEVEVLKQAKNQEFVAYEKKFEGDSGENVKNAEIQMKKELIEIDAQFKLNKQSVIDRLLKIIGDCEPEMHKNTAFEIKQAQIQTKQKALSNKS